MQKVEGVALDGGTKAVEAGPAEGVSITAEFAPGSAKRSGLRLRVRPRLRDRLHRHGSGDRRGTIPLALRPQDNGTVKLQVTVGGGWMILQADNCIRMAWPRRSRSTTPPPSRFFAEGGKAEFKSVTVAALK